MILAHQGGWDEALFVLVPLLLFAGLLSLARRRAEREAAERKAGSRPGGNPSGDDRG